MRGSRPSAGLCRRIRQVILKQFGVDYHPNYLAERLKAWGWTAQVPAVQARERDEELVRAWLERDWPRIKKKLGRTVRRSSLSTRPGSPPVEDGEHMGTGRPDPRPATDQQTSRGHHGGRTDAVGTDLQAATRRAVHGPDMVLFLAHLRGELAGAMIVLWDGLSVHKSEDVKTYLAEHPEISVETLPPYAPI